VAVETETIEVHRWSPEEYHRLIESGGFDEKTRIELIDEMCGPDGELTAPHLGLPPLQLAELLAAAGV
jgi:hypothetical protein